MKLTNAEGRLLEQAKKYPNLNRTKTNVYWACLVLYSVVVVLVFVTCRKREADTFSLFYFGLVCTCWWLVLMNIVLRRRRQQFHDVVNHLLHRLERSEQSTSEVSKHAET